MAISSAARTAATPGVTGVIAVSAQAAVKQAKEQFARYESR